MRDNLELNKDEVIKICKKQLVSNYVFSILFSILAIAIIAFFVINAIIIKRFFNTSRKYQRIATQMCK